MALIRGRAASSMAYPALGIRAFFIRFALGLMAAVVFPVQCPAERELVPVQIDGRVFLNDGHPAAGAKVSLQSIDAGSVLRMGEPRFLEQASCTTPQDGTFRFSMETSVALVVVASRKGWATTAQYVMLPVEAEPDELPMQFTLQPSAHLSGTVVDEQDRPVPGVEVRSIGISRSAHSQEMDWAKVCTTNANGAFVLDDISTAPRALSIDSPEFVPVVCLVDVPVSGVVMRVSRAGASLSGRVVFTPPTTDVPKVTVRLYPAIDDRESTFPVHSCHLRAEPDAEGNFRFTHLPAGQYQCLVLNRAGMEAGLRNGYRRRDQPVRVVLAANESRAGLVLEVPAGVIVHGIVRDSVTRKPLEAVEVRCNSRAVGDADSIGRTDANGKYSIPHVIRPASLSLKKPGYLESGNGMSQPDSESGDDGTTQVQVDLEMTPAVKIHGTVKDDAGGPVAGAVVSANSSSATTKADGSYSVDAEQDSSVAIYALLAGHGAGATTREVDVGKTDVHGVDIILKPFCQIEGVVVAEDGKPAEIASVHARRVAREGTENDEVEGLMPDSELSLHADPRSGKFRLAVPDAGVYSIRATAYRRVSSKAPSTEFYETVSAGTMASEAVIVTLEEGQSTAGLKLVLRNEAVTAVVQGKVTDQSGKPICGAGIMTEDRPGTVSGDDGSYKLNWTGDAVRTIVAYARGYGRQTRRNVRANQGNVDFVLKKDVQTSTILVVEVLDWKTRQPVSGAWVEPQYGASEFTRITSTSVAFTYSALSTGESIRGGSLCVHVPGWPSVERTMELPMGTAVSTITVVMGPGGTIKGRVAASEDGAPMANVRVEASGSHFSGRNQALCYSGEDGVYALAGLSPDAYDLQFSPPSPFVGETTAVQVGHGETVQVDVGIGTGATVRGRLISAPKDEPVADAEIVFVSESYGKRMKTTTDKQGRFSFTQLPSGKSWLYADEYFAQHELNVKQGGTHDVLMRTGGGILYGRIERNGLPYRPEGVSLQHGQSTCECGCGGTPVKVAKDGTFTAKGIEAGEWTIIMEIKNSPHEIRETFRVAEDANTVERTFKLPSRGIGGRVVDGTGACVAGATVFLLDDKRDDLSFDNMVQSGAKRVTGKDGTFEFRTLPAGRYALGAHHDGIATWTDGLEITQTDGPATVTLRLVAQGGATLVSAARNARDGSPVQSAVCVLAPAAGRIYHDAIRGEDGVQTVRGLPPGKYEVRVCAPGYAPQEHAVELSAGATVKLDDTLEEAGRLRWTILGANGKQVEKVTCKLERHNAPDGEKARQEDLYGEWNVDDLLPGVYTATVAAPGCSMASETLIIEARRTLEHVTQLK